MNHDTSGIRLNTGGTLDPESGQIWDREALIAEIWRTLETQSVYFTGERRMGKTSVISKMRADPIDDQMIVYMDTEKETNAGEFALLLYTRVTAALPALTRARGAMARNFKRRIDKLGIGPVSVEFRQLAEQNWPDLIDEVINALDKSEDLVRVVLCFDELPQMLKNIINQGQPLVARQILDKLRELRQTQLRVRMIFTGSIGLHHVERDLRELGSSWAPINDMKKIDIPPFQRADAEGLATVLLINERVPCDDLPTVAAAVARSSDGVPYYIHWIVDGLLKSHKPTTIAVVDAVVEAALADPDDAWGFRHQVTRVPQYYEAESDLAYATLDAVALTDGISFEQLMRQVSVHPDVIVSRDSNRLRALIELLERDHYLDGGGGTIRFRRTLMARAWKARRYLG